MSLFENNGEQEITVYILGEELSNDSMKKFNEIGRTYKKNIVIKDTKDIIEKMKSWGIPPCRWSYAANLRLFLPYLLEDSVSRVLYLDADTIITVYFYLVIYNFLQKSISPMGNRQCMFI